MLSCFAAAELTDKLAVSDVVWEGASHEVHRAGAPAGAAWGPQLGGCQVRLPYQHIPRPTCNI